MRYEEFNRLYKDIYKERFRPIKNTDFEYCYLEEEHYAVRRQGQIYFYTVRAKSPLEALDNLMKIKEWNYE